LRRRQALDQAVEQGLGLGVNPVQILEDQHQRLHLSLPQEYPLEGIERPSKTVALCVHTSVPEGRRGLCTASFTNSLRPRRR
jgi:hypothetical protein